MTHTEQLILLTLLYIVGMSGIAYVVFRILRGRK